MANPAIQVVTQTFGQILYSGQIATTAATAIYTVGASSTVKLASGTVCNTSGITKTVSDGATTNASTTVTSAAANFTAADIGKIITGAGVPASTTIVSVTNVTTIVTSAASTATATGVALTWGFPAVPVVVSVSLLKVGDTADGTHAVVSGYGLAANDTLSLRDYISGAMLAAGEAVSVTVSVASAVDVVVTGAVSS